MTLPELVVNGNLKHELKSIMGGVQDNFIATFCTFLFLMCGRLRKILVVNWQFVLLQMYLVTVPVVIIKTERHQRVTCCFHHLNRIDTLIKYKHLLKYNT